MRSAAEISFRLRQEAGNLRFYLSPPGQAPAMSKLALPDGEAIARRLRGTEFAARIGVVAQDALARKFSLLGYRIGTDREIRWRRDYVHGIESEAGYFRKIPYLDFERVGDHKIIWELNRHQHLVAMAQAGLVEERPALFEDVFAQLESWLDQNPPGVGINWTSALEVAFRALSWIWIEHLAGARMPAELGARWRLALYWHGWYLERNLSVYFSPNTHLQGEALALHALGRLFGVERWRVRGASLMRDMIRDHVHGDGGHFEQSSYYHVYATDMFLFHAVLEQTDEEYRDALRRMARYLWALAGSGDMPFLGDDDGGRLFHPFGDRRRFARGTLAACAAFLGDTPSHGDPNDLNEIAAWWLGEKAAVRGRAARVSEFFPETGVTTMVDEETEIVASVHAFGRGSAGHSHAHALHFTLRRGGEEVLIDPGTYTYVSDPEWRDRFRGTAAHNTVAIDGRDQADAAGPFRWRNPPETEILDWKARPWTLRARCRYRGLCHERRMVFSDGALWVIDDISSEGRRHTVEQFWHCAALAGRDPLWLPGGLRLVTVAGRKIELEEGWRSPAPGVKIACPVLRLSVEAELPVRLAVVFDSRDDGDALRMEADRLVLGSRELRL